MYKINLQQMEYFLTVAEKLNFTEAAKILYMSQPSLSKQISMIEEELGVELFTRNRRVVRLTPAGEILSKRWRTILSEVDRSVKEAVKAKENYTGEINIGFLSAWQSNLYIEPVMDKFHKEYPQITLLYESYSFKTLREKLMNGELDIIFTLNFDFDFSQNDGLLYTVIQETNLCLVVPTSNPLARREFLTLSDAKDQPFVLISPSDSPGGAGRVFSLCKSYGFKPFVKRYVPNVSSLAVSVINGVGLTITGDKEMFPNTDKLKFYPIPDRPHDSDIIAVWRERGTNPELSLLIAHLQKLKAHAD